MKNFKKDTFFKEFENAVQKLSSTKENATYCWKMGLDDTKENVYAIVLGWSDGFDLDDPDEYLDDGYRLCAKVAMQPVNSAMQSDYDIDWFYPVDEYGELFDTTYSLFPEDNLKNVAEFLIDSYENVKRMEFAKQIQNDVEHLEL